ncbi:hypothetical protein ACJX0J_017792, partial [Zea mays]
LLSIEYGKSQGKPLAYIFSRAKKKSCLLKYQYTKKNTPHGLWQFQDLHASRERITLEITISLLEFSSDFAS